MLVELRQVSLKRSSTVAGGAKAGEAQEELNNAVNAGGAQAGEAEEELNKLQLLAESKQVSLKRSSTVL